ncbi:hypothetical protein FRC07_014212 [Ceratobasidium sp. 392]|nr:hypothetical protein FRC07_014212 [Ceratobasidium sp. 392]
MSNCGATSRYAILEDDTLYVLLFLRSAESPGVSFHWALYHHYDNLLGGYKFHIGNLMTNSWISDHTMTKSAASAMFLVAGFAVGRIDPNDRLLVAQIVQQEDTQLNSIPETTCRTWLLRALSRLASAGLLPACIPEEVESEANTSAQRSWESAIINVQPRPVDKYSKFP